MHITTRSAARRALRMAEQQRKKRSRSSEVVALASSVRRRKTKRSSRRGRSANNTSSKRRQASAAASTERRSPPCKDWVQTYDLIEELRKDRTAPVDIYGSEALPLRPPEVSQDCFRYQTLIALMLSSQTKDPVVGAAIKRLQTQLEPDGLNVPNVMNASEKRVRELIYGVGFQNKKANYIKRATSILVESHDSRVPDTFVGLVSLPGVGPKMALIVLNAAFDKCVGVSIDTHLHRMLRQLGWVRKDTKTPEQTRRQLESWLPRERWKSMNLVWVGLGQEIQTEPGKLIRKAKNCSNPDAAIRLLRRLFGKGKLEKVAKKEQISLGSKD